MALARSVEPGPAGIKSLEGLGSDTDLYPTRRKNLPTENNQVAMPRSDRHSPGWGGRRKGSGRPLGSRNRPVLVDTLPATDDPKQWLYNAMNCPDLRLRLRVACAKTLLEYCCNQSLAGEGAARRPPVAS